MDKHWKRCALWAWNDQYESPCGNEENRTHRLNCSARNTDTSEKVDYCKADRVSKSIR